MKLKEQNVLSGGYNQRNIDLLIKKRRVAIRMCVLECVSNNYSINLLRLIQRDYSSTNI